ncbi:MAG: ABC transporter substrate-binding protein, partial [Desulfotignum balticum]|nr:ABC transporter substrate-binding protein [Desulfotignum balticum]
MRFHKWVFVLLVCCAALTGCSDNREGAETTEPSFSKLLDRENEPLLREYAPMPENIHWLTNDIDPVFASPDAEKGGLFRAALLSFPMTFRVVGPDSNGSFRSAILDNQLSL